MAITKSEFDAANRRGQQRLRTTPVATAARYDRRIGRIVIELSTGVSIAFSPHAAQGLERASPDQLREIEISPKGLGLHFPRLDADLYLPALLEGFFGSKSWMTRLAQRGGKVSSAAKAAAARENGKLGGRPKKTLAA